MPSSVHTIPTELGLTILQHLYNEDTAAFLTCLRVCRAWHDLALPILWKDLSADMPNAKMLLIALARAPLDYIQSVSVGRDAEPPSSKRMQGHQLLSWLMKWLPKMPNIQSFSCVDFLFEPKGNIDVLNPLVRCIESLAAFPLSSRLKSLELVNFGVDGEYEPGDAHLCASIAKVMPQLQHLRLSDTMVCLLLFETIPGDCKDLKEIILDCGSGCLVSHCLHETPFRHINTSNAMPEFLKTIEAAIAQGRFPKIEHFVICGINLGADRRDSPPSPDLFNCLYKIDVLRNIATSYPFGWVTHEGSMYSWLRYRDDVTFEQYDIVSKGMIQGADCLRDLVEGRAWLMSSKGACLPLALERNRDYNWLSGPSVSSMRQAANAFRSGSERKLRLWYWEDRVGRNLLDVLVDDATRVPDLPRRVRPSEELELDPQSDIARRLEWLDI